MCLYVVRRRSIVLSGELCLNCYSNSRIRTSPPHSWLYTIFRWAQDNINKHGAWWSLISCGLDMSCLPEQSLLPDNDSCDTPCLFFSGCFNKPMRVRRTPGTWLHASMCSQKDLSLAGVQSHPKWIPMGFHNYKPLIGMWCWKSA